MMTKDLEQRTHTDNLEEVANTYRAALPSENRYEFSITPLDRLGEPVSVFCLWGQDNTFDNGIGYGTSEIGSQVSALGEAAEGYYASRTLKKMERRRGSFRQMQAGGVDVVDPVSLCLDAGCGYTNELELTWIRGYRYPSRRSVWVPLEAVAIAGSDIGPQDADRPLLMKPITNGLGAGLSIEQALSHGILELIQRDGDSVTFRAMDTGVAVELDSVQDKETLALLDHLEREDIGIIVKVASTDLGIPVLYVVGADRDIERPSSALMLSACGEAAHPDREKALGKALREYVAARARKRFMHGSFQELASVAPEPFVRRAMQAKPYGDDPRAVESILEWIGMPRRDFYHLIRDPVLTVRSQVLFSSLPTCKTEEIVDPAALLDLLHKKLSAQNLEIIYFPFTSEDAPVQSVKAIVPGLEVETMSYGRIGMRNVQRLQQQGADFVSVGSPSDGLLPIYLSSRDEMKLGGKAWLHPDKLDKAVGKLYGLYREPHSHTIAHYLNEA